MRKNAVSGLCKLSFLSIMTLLFSLVKLQAQSDFPVGTGTVGNDASTFPALFPDKVEGSRAQYLFLASELQAAGLSRGFITGLKMNVISLNGAGDMPYTIKMGATNVNSLSTSAWEPSPTQYFTADSYQPVEGENTFAFTDKFFWNGTSNILVEICTNGGNFFFDNETVNATTAWTTGLSFNASHVYGTNNLSNICATRRTTEIGTATTRPNLTFTWTVAPPDCSGVPDAGTATSSVSVACPKVPFKLSLSAPAVMGLTYQWQYSNDNITWTNIVGATKDTVSVSLTTTTYYRSVVTCSISNQSATSASVTVSPTPAVSGTFTIDNSLVTPGPGQFKTFNDAYNYIKCGINGPVVFNVVNTGTPYNEQLIMTEVLGASATNTIVFNGNGASIQYLSTDYYEKAVIKLNGADHITFDSLHITALGNSSEYGFGFHLTNNADSNVIKNSTITVNNTETWGEFAGIVINGGDYFTASGSLCDGNMVDRNKIMGGIYGIILVGSDDMPVKNNIIANNTIQNFYDYGVYLSSSANTTIEGNDISRPNRISSSSVYGIYVSGPNLVTNISKNRIHAIFDSELTTTSEFYGISLNYADADLGFENVISNNLIYDIKGDGAIYALHNSNSNAALYYYNTVSLDDQNSNAQVDAYAFYNTNYTAGIQIKNNIFSISRSGNGLKYGIYIADDRVTLITSDNNNFFTNGNNTISTGYFKGITRPSLAAWKAATGFDANSIEVDPAFKDMAAGDFTPTSVAMGDKALPVAITVDLNNTARNTSTPDMGAYEYSLQACNTAFQAGDAFSSVGSISCTNKTATLNLKNNDVGLGLTYQWETASSLTGTWTPLSAALQSPPYSFTTGTDNLYYRAAVACNGGTPKYSTPIQITIGGHFPAGTYTIDKTQPSDPVGTKNFNSWGEAVSALSCGIAGPVVFNVKANVYEEQIRIPAIPNSSAVNTVTFQSENGIAASTELRFDATAIKNYVVQLDSASNVVFKNLTLTATNQLNGRVFDILNIASNDSILNCVINAPKPLSNPDWPYPPPTAAGILASSKFSGGGLVIKGNTIRRGEKGIYIVGPSFTSFTNNNRIENNTFDSSLQHSIYVKNASNIKINNNTIPVNTDFSIESYNQGVYGIYMNNCDSAIEVKNNTITIQNNTGYTYGIYMTENTGTENGRGKVMNNKVVAITGLTSLVNGLFNADGSYTDIINNELSVASSVAGTESWLFAAALVTRDARHTNYYNNSLLNTSPAAGIYNAALWVDHQYSSSGGFTNIFNNIIANKGGGPAAFYNYTAEHLKVDYNLLYSSGSLLVKQGPTGWIFDIDYNTISDWRAAYGVDMNSIVYNPAYTANDNLQPLASDANSWALQGRGIQLPGNNNDFNGNPRSVTLTDGVPDLGAYEFMPTVAPPALVATPATPAPGITQVFSMGSDTVTRITWAPGSTVPSAITLKRYSGVLPEGLAPTEKSLYYYVDADVTGAGPFNYNIKQTFIDPWLRTLPLKSYIKLGKTDAASVWAASANSTIDSLANVISDTELTLIDKFTGMTDGTAPEKPVYVTRPDSTNKGTRFWAPYSFDRNMLLSNAQQFKFILSSDVATEVTVSVNGTSYRKTYTIPAGGVITTDQIPRSGIDDARLREEGLSNRGILIESKDPITATAFMDMTDRVHGLLMPTGTYAKSYTTLGTRQFSGYSDPTMGTSWVSVIADNDNTVVEITPSGATKGGRAAGVPFRVTLNRGEVYQILGGFIRFLDRDITGGMDNAYESADLTGTTVVSVPNADGKCFPIAVFNGSGGTGIRCEALQNGADTYVFQQSYPDQAWGKRYLTAPLATQNNKNEHLFNMFRVMVKDPNTVVKRNGVVMTNLTDNYYQFTSREPEYIEADKPVMVSQMMTYFNSCGNDEYSNPGSNEGMLYLTPISHGIKKTTFYRRTGGINYITVVIPDAGKASLKIDGSNTFDSTYAHPQKTGYSVIMKSWPSANGVSAIESDSNFTALVHVPNNIEGYMYNIGYQVPRVTITNDTIHNVYNENTTTNAYTCVGTPFKPSIYLPVIVKTLTWKLGSVVGISPSATITENNPVPVDTVEINNRDFYVYSLNQSLKFTQTGNYTIPVSATYSSSATSCDTEVDGEVTVVVVTAPDVDYTYTYTGCLNADATFTATGTVGNGAVIDRWNWNFGDNTSSTHQNPVKKWTTAGNYNVILSAIANDGCLSDTVTKVVVANPLLDKPVATVDSIGVHGLRFKWNVITGAVSYQVSIDGGNTWNTPSSGATGETHLITGLRPGTTVTLLVRANGSCAPNLSESVSGTTYTDNVYVPNTFTPNGDGLNDVFKVYAQGVKEMKFMVFNQWGQKMFETNNPAVGWDGKFNGKLQPTGVYLYVCRIVLATGEVINKKGNVTLVR